MSGDKNVVATISTRGAKTSGGKHAVGKILKFRYDMLFFTMVQTRRMVVALTENDMYEQCLKKAKGGRVPSEIEVVYAPLPEELNLRLVAARQNASVGSGGIG